jgi:hypothetical protein
MLTRRFVMLSLAGLLTAGSVACKSEPPRGSNSGRIDPSITTDAEINDARILPVSLMEFSDQVAQQVAQDIGEMPEIAPGGARSTIILGDINNKTTIVSSDEFELARARIRNTLLSSKYVRGKVAWVENRARLASLAAREGVGTASNPAGPDAYDPRNTFTLNMDVYRINRGRVNQYYVEAQIVSFSSNEIILSKRYEVKQVRGG